MRDGHQGLTNQEEKKEPNEPIKYADLHKLYWFMVSLDGKGTQFRAKDYEELREFTAKDLKLMNTDYLLIYRAPKTELMIKN